MKKCFIFFTVIFSNLICSVSMASTFATVVTNCPVTSGNPANQLHNYGYRFIAGNGIETVDVGDGPQSSLANFRTIDVLPANIPTSLTTYSSVSVDFNNDDPNNLFITCNYSSSNPDFPNFSVIYGILNGFGAIVSSTTASSVTYTIPIGLRGT